MVSEEKFKRVLYTASLIFYYGAMGSSKSANALMANFNHQEVGKVPLLCKPRTDTRDGERIITSRIGLSAPCVYLEEVVEYLYNKPHNGKIIIDDAMKASIDAYYAQYGVVKKA